MKLSKKNKTRVNKLWKNRNNKQRSFIIVVLLPTFFAAIYYAFIASGQYVVESQFSVKGNEMQQLDLLSGIAGVPSQGGSATDSYIVQDYIHSVDMLNALSKNIDVVKLFNPEHADWWARLGAKTTQEERVDYWKKMVTAAYDPTTTIITLTVRTFSAADSKMLAEQIIQQSEWLVNQLSERSRTDDLAFARAEVDRAEARVSKARKAMNEFRTANQNLDPTQSATAQMMLIGELEGQLAKAQTELSSLLSYMGADAPAVKNVKRNIKALNNQIEYQKNHLTGTETNNGETALTNVFAQYEPLLVEREFAEKAYTSALASLESARVEASRKHRYLSTFVEPTLPDEAIEPRRFRSVITVFLASLLVWAIGLLGGGIIREHVGWV
ncbi:capsule biosynthesis protein [Salinivibrio kushneri]|uniref:capsule biosynthesis protein n=1 Tax=Salinivibrio kushneri TaxID=1908198 RepID=UPI000C85C7C3|nr:capsule biosynthesis protein [Salinivibrio kushneri]